MKIAARTLILTVVLALGCSLSSAPESAAQPRADRSGDEITRPMPASGTISVDGPSGKAAFMRSLLLPGWGHRYARGRWERSGVFFSTTETLIWLNLFAGEFRRNHLIDSYTTLAVSSAEADVSGKDRTFFLNLASFESSAEFRNVMLRTRQWDRIDYVSDPSFFWDWESTEDFARYRELRDDAESLRRRRSILIASLVANRVFSGILAARRAGKMSEGVQVAVRFGPPPRGSSVPVAHLGLTF